MEKLLAFFDVLRKGSAVADPQAWKDRTTVVTVVGALLMSISQGAKAFGYDLGVDHDTATAIAGGVGALWLVWSHFATTDKVGLLPPKREAPDADQGDMRGGP